MDRLCLPQRTTQFRGKAVLGGLGLLIVGGFPFILILKTTLVVTDQRIYGITWFGHRVDIPIDSVSSVGIGWLSSIAVVSVLGKTRFFGIANTEEVHQTIIELLQGRSATANVGQDNTAQLKALKELLDSGVITQEEFEAKKKQLLEL